MPPEMSAIPTRVMRAPRGAADPRYAHEGTPPRTTHAREIHRSRSRGSTCSTPRDRRRSRHNRRTHSGRSLELLPAYLTARRSPRPAATVKGNLTRPVVPFGDETAEAVVELDDGDRAAGSAQEPSNGLLQLTHVHPSVRVSRPLLRRYAARAAASRLHALQCRSRLPDQ